MPTRPALVSVVTPAYNAERFLRECIESVLAQTYDHWDYSIINNRSTDATLEIALEYAARDPRIRVVTNDTFVPVIQNYNAAFRATSPGAKYCKPLAADDVLLPRCLDGMVAVAEANPSVGIVSAHGLYSCAEMGVSGRGIPYPTQVVSGRWLCRSYLLRDNIAVFGAASLMMFRADIVRARPSFYNEANIHADSEACVEVLEQHDLGFLHEILTLMRIQHDSLSAESHRMNTYLPYRLHVLEKFGPNHLTSVEMDRERKALLREYYEYLAGQLLEGRDTEFWRYHREQFAKLGYSINRARIAGRVVDQVMDLLLNPKSTVESAVRKLWRRSS